MCAQDALRDADGPNVSPAHCGALCARGGSVPELLVALYVVRCSLHVACCSVSELSATPGAYKTLRTPRCVPVQADGSRAPAQPRGVLQQKSSLSRRHGLSGRCKGPAAAACAQVCAGQG